jgi:hypothetical protein
MSDRALLHIVHMDDSFTEVEVGVEGAQHWLHTPMGLVIDAGDDTGMWTRWPFATVKSYTVTPIDGTNDVAALDPGTTTAGSDAGVIDPDDVTEPGTRWSTLCVRDGRQDGAVTVGDSRLPAAVVLDSIRVRGVAEAARMWPALTDDDLRVLTTLVVDLDMRAATTERPGPSTVTNPHRVQLCWVDDQNHGRVSVFPNRAPVHSMVARVLAGEDLGAVARDYDIPRHELAVVVRLAEELITNVDGPEHLGAPDRATYEQQGGF